MKQIIQKLWMVMAMLWASLSALAYDFEVDGIYYNIISIEELTCEVTYNPDNKNTQALAFFDERGSHIGRTYCTYPSYTGCVTIPAAVNYKGRELSIIGIGEYAFLNCTGLTSLSLPSSITQIKEVVVPGYDNCYAGAFDYCNIETFTAGNAYTLEMFNQSYASSDGYQTRDNLRNLILTNDFLGTISVNFTNYTSLVSIRSNTVDVPAFSEGIHFSNNQYLNVLINVPSSSSLELYKSSTPWSSFWDIVTLDDTQTPPTTLHSYDFVVNGIFYNIISLEELTCEVTYNHDNYPSYSGCVTIPATLNYKGRELSVTGIGVSAFLNCTGLTSLSLPSSITQIKTSAFTHCNIETFSVGNAYTLERAISECYSLENLILTNDFFGTISANFSECTSLVSIVSNAVDVPAFSDGNHFTNLQFINTEVFVPEETFSEYQSANIWKDFWELKAMKSVESISLNETTLNLEPKQTFQLVPTILPDDAFDTSVLWSSSNPNVATVDADGIVSAITKGDAIITVAATDGSGATAECSIHVDLLVKGIQLSDTELGLEPGNSKQLEVTLSPNDAFVKDVIWSSDAEEIASVDQNGNVTANNIGIANIQVATTDGSNLTATCKITVAELVKSIVVSPDEATINEGETLQLSCVVSPETATYKDVVWDSEDEDIATVNSEGVVTAISPGSVKIKAIASDGSNIYGESTITVNAVTTEYDGICYQRNSPSTLKIVGNPESPYSGDIFIPSSAIFDGQEMQVTEIGVDAFAGCEDLTRIVIPNTINKISETSFNGCSNLVYVKLCDGSSLEANFDAVFSESPINELYVGSDGITYNSPSRLLSIIKGMTLGNNVTTFPPAVIFNSLEYFIVEDGDLPIIETDEYLSKSVTLVSTQDIYDVYEKTYYRFIYSVIYTHLSPIINAIERTTLDYLHIGREVQCVEVDTSIETETKPTIKGGVAVTQGWVDEYIYSYNEMIVKNDYNRNPVESISMSKSVVELNIGEVVKLSAVCLPENASFITLEWSSSNEDVAIVDIFGNVTKLADGEATITASTTDGSNLSAICKIVNPGASIEDVIAPIDCGIYLVYNLQGIMILKTDDPQNINRLPAGIYIVNGHKVAIK